MSTARKQWLLKVIAGPHQGAEITLSAGKTLVGSDDACDVVLHDVLVAPQHVELELADAGITAAPLGGRVFVGGKRIRESRQSVPEFVFVSIGGTHFVIGNAAAKWPLLSAADVPELEKEVEAKAAEPAAKKEEEAKAPTAVAVSAPVSATPAATAKGSRLGPFLGIAAGVLMLIIWAVVYRDFFNVPQRLSEEEAAVSNKPADRIRKVIADMELTDSVKIVETAGRITVTGYVDTEGRQRELQAAFREAAPGLHTKIYSLEKIVSSARSMIDDQHLALTATSLSEGKIKVTGQLTSAEPWVRMKQKLLREVPGLSNIEDSVEIAAQPQPLAAMPKPAAHSLTTKTIYLPAPQTARPAPAATSVPMLGDDPSADYAITADTIDTPESTVASIKTSAEGLNFMRLNTGGIYFAGARLPYGGSILKIDADAATIHERGKTRVVRIGDLVAQTKAPTATTATATGGKPATLTKSNP